MNRIDTLEESNENEVYKNIEYERKRRKQKFKMADKVGTNDFRERFSKRDFTNRSFDFCLTEKV